MVNKKNNCIVGEKVTFGKNVTLGHNVIIEDNVYIGDNTYIDSNTVVRSNTNLGKDSFVGANCIIGEYWMDFCLDRKKHIHPLVIGKNALIRSGSVIYAGSEIGDDFQTGIRLQFVKNLKLGIM